MGPSTIARNYAETLFELARKQGGSATVEEFASAIDSVTEVLDTEPLIRQFLETPRVEVAEKKRAIRASFGGRVPEYFLRFLLVVVEKRRQGLLREIGKQYHALVDESLGRVRATITLPHEPDEALRQEIRRSLETKLSRTVLPEFQVEPGLIGGVIIRVGDQVLDGSIRRRLADLRKRMLSAELPRTPAEIV